MTTIGIMIALGVMFLAIFSVAFLILLELKEIVGYMNVLEVEIRHIDQTTTRLLHDYVNNNAKREREKYKSSNKAIV